MNHSDQTFRRGTAIEAQKKMDREIQTIDRFARVFFLLLLLTLFVVAAAAAAAEVFFLAFFDDEVCCVDDGC
jgi:hypothetical protein